MELIRIKCPKCRHVTNLKSDVLAPFSNKIVGITCANSSCGYQIKVQVPDLEKRISAVDGDEALSNPVTFIPPQEPEFSFTGAGIEVQENQFGGAQVFTLKEGVNTIGRFSNEIGDFMPDIALLTKDKRIGRNHCQMVLTRNSKGEFEVILKDNDSKNGTFLDGGFYRLRLGDEIYLSDGETVLIGETTLLLEFYQKQDERGSASHVQR